MMPVEWWLAVHAVGALAALIMFLVYAVLVVTGVIKR